MNRSKNGITLVALIITVIVLLILAMVSISLVINSGIIDKAKYGVDKYSEEEELEQIKLAVTSAQLKGNGFLTTENLNSELRTMFGENAEERSNGWRFKDYNIKENGEIKKSILPKDYQEVEYIKSTGGQWINTNINIEFGYSFAVDCKMNESNNLGWNTIVGAYNDGSNKFRFVFNPNGKEIIGYIDGSGGTKRCQNIFNRGVATIRFISGNNYFDYNNASFYTNQTSFGQSVSGTFLLFCDNRGRDYFRGNIYSVQIKDINNDLIRNLVPCYRINDNIAGLYDTVEGKFYTNQGTGTFLKGNDV